MEKMVRAGNRFDFPTGILNFETLLKRIITITIALAMALHAFAQSAPRPQLPETVAYSQRAKWGPLPAQGRSFNFVPSFFIYPDTKLDEQGARALVESLGMQGVLDEHHGSVFMVNPAGEKYADSDYEAFEALYNLSWTGNAKVIGLGNGATFVNTVIAPRAAGYISGIMICGGKPAKAIKGDYPGVPAYVAGKNAKKVAAEYEAINAAQKEVEPLLQVVTGPATASRARCTSCSRSIRSSTHRASMRKGFRQAR